MCARLAVAKDVWQEAGQVIRREYFLIFQSETLLLIEASVTTFISSTGSARGVTPLEIRESWLISKYQPRHLDSNWYDFLHC